MTEKRQSSRIAALDLMRGYFLIAIVLNHLHYFPNGLELLTFRGELFVSAAEGFFLISGIVLGIVRGRKLVEKPLKVATGLLLKRAGQLYVTYVILTILFTLIGWAFFMHNPGLKFGIADMSHGIGRMIWQTLTFQYLYGWADYLRLYAIFIAISPLVVWLLRHGKWWLVSLASLAVWLLSPVTPWPESMYLQIYKWQLLFFAGMVIGYHWPEISGAWKRLPVIWRKASVASLVSISLALLALNVFLAFGGKLGPAVYDTVAPIRDQLHQPYFDKENLPWARVLVSFVWFWAAFWFFSRFSKQLTKWFGWILVPFGTNSLYVYTVHAFLIFFIHLLIQPGGTGSYIINTLLTLMVLGIIWIMVRYKILFKVIPR